VAGISLGEALFDISLDLSSFRSQFDQVKKIAADAGKSVNRSVISGTEGEDFAGLKGKLVLLKKQQKELDALISKWKDYGAAGRSLRGISGFKKQTKRAAELKLQIEAVTKATKKLKAARAADLKLQQQEAQKVKAAYDALKAAKKGSFIRRKGTLGGLEMRITSLKEEIRQVKIGSTRYKQLAKEIRKATAESTKARGVFEGGGLSKAAIKAATITGIIALGVALTQSTKKAIEFQKQTAKIAVTLGESGAAESIKFVRETANELGVSFDGLIGSFGGFTAAATGAGIALEDQKDLFKAVSRAASQMGASQESVNSMFLALEQMAGKGVVSMQELKTQFGQQLPTAMKASEIGMNLNYKGLMSLVEAGDLTAREFFPKLTKGLNQIHKGAGGARTTSMNLAKLANEWGHLQVAVGQNLLPATNVAIYNMGEALEFAANNTGTLISALAGIGSAAAVFYILANATEIAAKAQLALSAAASVAQSIMNPANILKIAAALAVGAAVYSGMSAYIENAGKAEDKLTAKRDAAIRKANAWGAKRARQEAALKALKLQTLLVDREKAAAELQSIATGKLRISMLQKEQDLVNNIANTRNQSIISRATTIKSLLGIESNHAQAMAADDKTRQQIKENYGARIYRQTVKEFSLRAKALVAEQEGARVALQFKQQGVRIALRQRKIEADIALIDAKAKAAEKPNDANLKRIVELRKAALLLVQNESRELQGQQTLENELLGVQQTAAKDRLKDAKVLELASQKQYANADQLGQLQGEINGLYRGQTTNIKQATVAATDFRTQIEGSAKSRANLSDQFQATVKTTLDGSQTFSTMNKTLTNIETNTANAAKQPINIYMTTNPQGQVTSATSGTQP